jgi:hypothetical protein
MARRILPRQGPAGIAGSARIQLRSRQHPDRSFIVGPFDTLRGALEFARALAEESGPVLSLRVEHRDGRRWKPAWSWAPQREATR